MATKMTGAMLLGLLWLLPPAAGAQSIRPECAKMRDKIGCTCALNHGGRVDAKTHRWFSVTGRTANNRGAANQAFTNCVAKGGRG